MSPLRISQESGLVKRADSLLTHLIRDLGIEDGIRLAMMKREWYSLFQKPLSYHVSPCRLSEGELLLNVDSPVWLQELNFFKEEIIKKLGSYGVREVRFKLGRIPRANENTAVKDKKSGKKHLKDGELEFVDKTVSHISDESLKTTVKSAMQKAITSGKTKIS